MQSNGISIDSHYAPFGLNESQWFNSRWTNPYIYYRYNLTSDYRVTFTDGKTTLWPRANLTAMVFPDSAILSIDGLGN